jgi:uncharacterized protein YkwD
MKIKLLILQFVICLSSFSQTTLDSLIFNEVNEYRQKNNLELLSFSKIVWEVSLHHTNYMVNMGIMKHSEETLKTPSSRMDFYNVEWNYCGENLAVINPDNKSPEEIAILIVEMWVDSPKHHKVLLSTKPTLGAVSSFIGDKWGHYENTDWLYVTLNTIK